MRHPVLFLGIATLMLASCTIQEEFRTPVREDVKFLATFEQPDEAGTKVYANQDLCLRWDADDRVSIFNRNTYNQQYRFLGETGANAGEFEKVEGAEFVTGNPLEHVVSFYPYTDGLVIGEDEGIEYSFPEEQFYRTSSFGKGAGPMVSVSEGNVLQYRNVGGFLTFSLYGQGAVKSIHLEGNQGERLSGQGRIRMPLGGEPAVEMYYGSTGLHLICERTVVLEDAEEAAKEFWFVLPPTEFRRGFTVTIETSVGTFRKQTTKSVTIERNRISRMSPIRIGSSDSPVIVFEDQAVKEICVNHWDINLDGELTREEAAAVTDLSFAFKNNGTIGKFNELQYFTGLTEIPSDAFSFCTALTEITLPESVKTLGQSAFSNCTALSGINLPEGLEVIDYSVFYHCHALASLEIPASVVRIAENAFQFMAGLNSIRVDEGNPYYDSRNGCNAIIVTETNSLLRGCATTVVPDSVTELLSYSFSGTAGLTSFDVPSWVTGLGISAFSECVDLVSVTVPASVTDIGQSVLRACPRLTSIVVDPANPVYDSRGGCNAIIETATNKLHTACRTTVIPETVTVIGQEAYADNDFLVGSFVVPEWVTVIGQVAFVGSKYLESLTLPSGLQEIGIFGCSYCPMLSSITILAPEPPELVFGQFLWPFQQNAPDCKVYVPAESLETYRTAWYLHADEIFPIE